jgi:hypothetical protein
VKRVATSFKLDSVILMTMKSKDKVGPLLKHHAMNTCEVDAERHSLTSALEGNEWLVSRFGHFTPGERNLQYPLDRSLGGPTAKRSPALVGNRTTVVHHVACHLSELHQTILMSQCLD